MGNDFHKEQQLRLRFWMQFSNAKWHHQIFRFAPKDFLSLI